jgi:hypothetical protein
VFAIKKPAGNPTLRRSIITCHQVDRESRIQFATNEERTERSVRPSTSITFRNPFRMNTYKSLSKQATLTTFRMNTYKKPGGEGGYG